MSEKLLGLVQEFLEKKMAPNVFVDAFIIGWKGERDCGENIFDHPQLSEVLSSIFCAADMFNPHADKEEYEFDELQLRSEIERLIQSMSGKPGSSA